MKVMITKTRFAIAVMVLSAACAQAEEADSRPFQASLTPEIAIYPTTTEIRGLSLNIWGENPQHGLTLGFVNGSTGESGGFTWGLYNYTESYTGVQWGIVNYSTRNFIGWQGTPFFWPCLANVSKGSFTGFQFAWGFNYAQDMRGLQLALVNYSEHLHGVQIGLANIAMNNSWFHEFPDKLATGFPILNWSF
jgi:hypothetical protein